MRKSPNTPHRFKKGVSGNPKGRPRGTYSEQKLILREIQKRSINDVDEIYEEIREKMRAGEAWAYQLYVKDLLPKKAFEPKLLIEMREGENRLEALIRTLSQFIELTHEEILNEIKVLSYKNDEADLATKQRIERESEEQLMAKAQNLRDTIEFIEWKNKKNNSLH